MNVGILSQLFTKIGNMIIIDDQPQTPLNVLYSAIYKVLGQSLFFDTINRSESSPN